MKNENIILKTISNALSAGLANQEGNSADWQAMRALAALNAAGYAVVRKANRPSADNALYVFSFAGGGGNQVWAQTKAEAIEMISTEYAGVKIVPEIATLKRVGSKEKQREYFRGLPLMD